MSDKHVVAALQRSVAELEAERLRLRDVVETWRERAERAESRLASVTGMQREELARTTAAAQREACAGDLGDWLGMLFHNADGGQSPIPHAEIEAIRRMVRATPLVTEVES